jgi:hypothetical protein
MMAAEKIVLALSVVLALTGCSLLSSLDDLRGEGVEADAGTAGGAGGAGNGGRGGSGAQSGASSGSGGTLTAGGAGTSAGGAADCLPPADLAELETVQGNPEYPLISDGFLYFSTDAQVGRIPAEGGALEWLSDGSGNNEGIAIVGARLAWADRSRGEIREIDLADPSQAPRVLASAQPGVQEIVADEERFYWTMSAGIVKEAGLLVSPILYPSQDAFALALRAGELYWITIGGELFTGSTDGQAAPIELAAQPRDGGGAWDSVAIAVDDAHVYFTATAGSTPPSPEDGIWRVPHAGGRLERLGAAPGADGIALTESCVYWGGRDETGGKIWVRDKGLVSPAKHLSGLGYPRGLAVEGTGLFVTDSLTGMIARVEL